MERESNGAGRSMRSRVAKFRRWVVDYGLVSDPNYIPKWRLDYLTWKRDPDRWVELFCSKEEIFSGLCQNQIHKCQMLQGFLAVLLQLLYHSTHSILNNLEKELRFLLTILGDVSWMLVDSVEQNSQFQVFVAGFEAVSNQAGCFLYSFFLESDVELRSLVMESGVKLVTVKLATVLNNIDLLKATIQSSELITTPETPRTSIVNSFIFLDSLVNDLRDLIRGEDTRIADVKDLIKLLHQGLSLLHSSINDRRLPQPSQNIGQLKEPLMRRIGDIAHQAQYLISAFLVDDAPLWYVITRLTFLNHKIQHIRRELQVITENYESKGLRVNAQRPLLEERENDSNELLVGFEDEARDILDQLVGEGRQTRLVISIIGMPGIGKTTLAKKLYNHPSVRDRFDKLSWFVVSQNFERQSILTAILIHINNDLDKDVILNMEEETSVEHIHKTLKGRRYLIVMDDVWNSSVWNELQRCLPDDGNGSRILLTSRNKSVAPPNIINHELAFLLDEQCWELLEKKVFGRRSCPPQLQPIGKKIAAKCCGLPLTVVVIAGVLSTVDEEESAWEEVGGSLDSLSLMKYDEDNTVMQILELSYKHLPVHLKPCFLFLGSYKEDEEVRVEKLKRLWIAEGFIREEFEKSKENVAEEYLMELIDKSLVMVARISWDGRRVKACVVHDLLRDLCLKISQGESFLQYLDKFNSISVGRHCA